MSAILTINEDISDNSSIVNKLARHGPSQAAQPSLACCGLFQAAVRCGEGRRPVLLKIS